MKSLKLNALLNILQNICKIIFPLITIPYASRILHATNYGRVSFSNSIVRYFILLAGLGIASYAYREGPAFRDNNKKFNDFANELFTINFISVITSYSVLILLTLFSIKIRDYYLIIAIQSVSIILSFLGADWINTVYEDYFFITIRYLIMQVISLILMFICVKNVNDYLIYTAITVLATAGGNILNFFHIRKYARLRLVSLKRCKKHIKSILLLFGVSITTIIYVSSDITILGFFKSDFDVGIYTMSSNIYSVIKQIISAIIVVSIPRMAYFIGNKKENEYEITAKRIINTLITILLPSAIGLYFLSTPILSVLGGKEYTLASNSLKILSITVIFAILSGFYANCYLLLYKKDKVYLVATIISSVLNVLLNFLIIPKMGINGAALTTLLAELTMSFIAGMTCIKEKKIFPNNGILISSFIGTIVVGGICYIISHLIKNNILIITISICISVLLYFIIEMLLKNEVVMENVNRIKRRFLNVN